MASNTYNITPKRLNSDGDYDTINFNTIADDVYFNNTNSATSYATYGLPCLTSTQNQGTTAELAYYTRTGWFPMPSGVGLTVDAWNSTTRILSAYNTTTVLTAVDGNYYMSVGDKIKFTGTTDNSTYYGIITGVSINGTSLYYSIFFGQNVSSYAGGAPKNIYYSKQKSPTGFPTGWYLEVSSTVFFGVPSATAGTFYSVDNLNLSLPVGMWNVDFRFLVCCNAGLPYCSGGISTNTTSLSLPKTVSRYFNVVCGNFHGKEKITISSATNLYSVFVASSDASVYSPTDAYTENFIRAECAYI